MYFLGLITRCKNEFFIEEFCNYYLSQGVNIINIIDDNSINKTIYNNLLNNKQIIIHYMTDSNDKCHNSSCSDSCTCNRVIANDIYQNVKGNFKWMIYVDVDEFITTRKNISNTIKQELETTFKEYDCIKIPWVMMACNNIDKNPESVLKTNVYRWNHNKKHPHKIQKFRCRFWNIEVKCIFKTEKFNNITDHYPTGFISNNVSIIDSIKLKKQRIANYYNKLREEDIENGYLLCYHYRIISRENSENKLKNNKWYIENGYTIEDLMTSDHSEIVDKTLKNKAK